MLQEIVRIDGKLPTKIYGEVGECAGGFQTWW